MAAMAACQSVRFVSMCFVIITVWVWSKPKKTRQVPNVLIGLNVFVHWLWEVAMCGLPDTGFRRVLFSGAIGKYLLQKHQGSKVLTPRDFALGWCQPVILCTKVSPFEALTPRCTIRHQNA